MKTRHPGTTIADFVLRFAALLALTIAVLMGVAVRARDSQPARLESKSSTVASRETAADVNRRRYPLVHPGSRSAN
jgi:NAD/NADP transhydrogenase alpha subunit|nr:hypothetical protein [Panacagrimonas sp.]